MNVELIKRRRKLSSGGAMGGGASNVLLTEAGEHLQTEAGPPLLLESPINVPPPEPEPPPEVDSEVLFGGDVMTFDEGLLVFDTVGAM